MASLCDQYVLAGKLSEALKTVSDADFVQIIEAAVAPVGWQPIETAPKDGTIVLVWDGENMAVADWVEFPYRPGGGWMEGIEVFSDPTHWMPLPEPPK
jgi:hypothetical protein